MNIFSKEAVALIAAGGYSDCSLKFKFFPLALVQKIEILKNKIIINYKIASLRISHK